MDNLESLNLDNIKNNSKLQIGPSLEEKIDYIYNSLKAQKRNSRIKLGLKLFVLFLMGYFIFFYIPSLPQEKKDAFKETAIKILKENISSIVTPLVKDLTSDIMKDMSKNGATPLLNGVNLEDVSKEVLDSSGNISSSKVEEFLKKHPELKDKLKANNNF